MNVSAIYAAMTDDDKKTVHLMIERMGKEVVRAKMEEPTFLQQFERSKKVAERKTKALGLERVVGE